MILVRGLWPTALFAAVLSSNFLACSDDSAQGGASSSTGTAGSGGTGGWVELPPLPEVHGVPPVEDTNPNPTILEVELVARSTSLEISSGGPTDLLTYNDVLPGPMIHARVGDRVIIHFTNELDEATTIHWHGLRITDDMDGSPMIQNPVEPGETFTYDFVVPDAGTFWYHTHFHQIEQFEKGLYGALVVHEADYPVFSNERIFVADDIRLNASNQVSNFLTSGPDIGMGRVGNLLLVNGRAQPEEFDIPVGGIERWRFVQATNALYYGLTVRGADVRVISTDGGLLPEPFPLERVEIAPGQRYDFEVRPHADAEEVVLEALVLVLDENNEVVEAPFPMAVGRVSGSATAAEPVYPSVSHPDPTVMPARELDWALSGALVDGKPEFTINGEAGFASGDHDHVVLETFEEGVPVSISLKSNVSPAHPFHLHGQFFQVIARDGDSVNEPGLRDTVHVRGNEEVTILSYFENPGQWMVHCHISEHSENGMMADVVVTAAEEETDPEGADTSEHNHE